MAAIPEIATVFVFGARDNVGFGATRYLAAVGGTTLPGPTPANEMAAVIPRKGTLKNLSWSCYSNTLSGGTGTCTIIVRVNGADTALKSEWTLPAQPAGGTFSANVSVNPGERVSVIVRAAGTAGDIRKLRVSFELEVDSTNPWWLNGQDVYYDGAGRVAIGTDTPDVDPAVMLTVDGIIKSGIGGFQFPDDTVQTTAFDVLGGINALTGAGGTPPDAVYVDGNGRVGIGIGSARMPQERLTLAPNSNSAIEMPTPTGVSAAEQTGGQLPADDYFFRVAASDGTGWTKASPQLAFSLLTMNGIRISWDPVLGATEYRVYRAPTAAGPYKYDRTTNSYYDYLGDAQFPPAEAVPPEETTAYINKLSASGPSWINGGNVGIGTTRPAEKLTVNGEISCSGLRSRGPLTTDSGQGLSCGGSGSIDNLLTVGSLRCRGPLTLDPGQELSCGGNGWIENWLTVGTLRCRGPLTIDQDLSCANNGWIQNWLTVGALRCRGELIWESTRRSKRNIKPIKGALEKIQRLQGVSFDWEEKDKHDIGLIAEDVGEVIPELVTYEENGKDAQGLDYGRLVAVVIEAVKEQQQQIDALQAAVKSMTAKK